jgi:hypothetical protein
MAVSARETRFGFNIGSTWGTAVAVGAGDGHYLFDDLEARHSQQVSLNDSAGQNFVGSAQLGFTSAPTGSIKTYCHYDDAFQNILWAAALGGGDTTPDLVSGTVYDGAFVPIVQNNVVGTIAYDKGFDVTEFSSVKLTGFELRSADMGKLELVFPFIANNEILGSVTNDTTQIAALTFPTLGLRAFLRQGVLRVNAASGGALASPTDDYQVTSIGIRYAQPYDTIHVGGQRTIIEPRDTGFVGAEIQLTLPRGDTKSDDFFAWHRDGTLLKADFVLTGPTLEATVYRLSFEFPNLIVSSEPVYPVPGGGGQMAPTVMLTAMAALSAPTGMTTTTPLQVFTRGQMSTNPFA